jgi:hypothetical protein
LYHLHQQHLQVEVSLTFYLLEWYLVRYYFQYKCHLIFIYVLDTVLRACGHSLSQSSKWPHEDTYCAPFDGKKVEAQNQIGKK